MTADTGEQGRGEGNKQLLPPDEKIFHTRYVVYVVLLFQERKTVKANHFVSDPIRSEKVTNSFRDQEDDLRSLHMRLIVSVCMNGHTMVGKMYVNAPVSSNIMTTTDTVILMTPLRTSVNQENGGGDESPTNLRAAAAPRKAYVPGMMQGTSGAQNLNTPDCGYALTAPIISLNLNRKRK